MLLIDVKESMAILEIDSRERLRKLLAAEGLSLSKSALSKAFKGRGGVSLDTLSKMVTILDQACRQRGLKIIQIMNPRIDWAKPDDPIGEVAKLMMQKDYSQMPVGSPDKCYGVIMGHIALGLLAKGNNDLSRPAREFCSDVVKVPCDFPISTARQFVRIHGYVLVEKNQKVVGIVTYGDYV